LATIAESARTVAVPTADFQIAYDGPSLSTGEMDVRDLAPALLAVGDLCQEANLLLNGDRSAVAVNVKAVRRGSFELHLILDQVHNVAGLFPADIKTAKQLAYIIFGSQGGMISLIALIKLLRGKPIQPKQIKQILTDGSTVIDLSNTNMNNSQITIAPHVKRLYEDGPARKSVERIVRPLEEPGIDTFQVRENDAVLQEIHSDEVDIFKVPPSLLAQVDSSENERVTLLQVVTASFEDRYQWRFTDGNSVFMAPIADDKFFERIDNGERFGKGDVLRVRLYEHQWRDEKGLHVEYKILEVLEVIPAPTQLKLG
jgi:hypothetical protein